jgi:hypothetical protein
MRRLCPAKSASHGTLPQLQPLGAGKGASSMVAAGGKPNGLTGVKRVERNRRERAWGGGGGCRRGGGHGGGVG